MTSCLNPDCDLLVPARREEECSIIISKVIDSSSSSFHVVGIDPVTGDTCNCKTGNRWWGQFTRFMKKGDTIIKKKGEAVFNIHRSDTTIVIPYECEGKKYR